MLTRVLPASALAQQALVVSRVPRQIGGQMRMLAGGAK